MPKFIGQKKIASTKDVEGKVEITYQDGTKEILKKELYEAMAGSPIDPSSLQEKRVEPIVKAALELLLDWDIRLEDFDYILSKLRLSVEDNMRQANEKLWGNKIHDRKISDVDKVLKQ
jgi:hypothetical protein